MAEAFLGLGEHDRKDALLHAASLTGRPAYLLEKDVWVVWTLGAMFNANLGEHLVFKGGTSLSKAYDGLIQRFSEDIDLTYDIREIIPDLPDSKEPIPNTRSQAGKWTQVVRNSLPTWVRDQVIPVLDTAIMASGVNLEITQDGDKLRLQYAPLVEGGAYVKPEVLLEFGARSTGEPAEKRRVVCDTATSLPDLVFPEATPRVMVATRTFWEKATAAHVYCLKGEFRGERYARHWHDIGRLAAAGISSDAIADRELAACVADHKQAFFRERAADGTWIDYHMAIDGALRLVPEGEALANLRDDYQNMIDGGFFEVTPEPFEDLMTHCHAIESEANRIKKISK